VSAKKEKTEPSVLQGFKAFLMRGNVVDLAVAVVIGAAFTNIVNSVVKGLINPLVGAVGTQNLDNYSTCLSSSCKGTHGIQLMWGSVLGATLTFLVTASVVYFLMVLPMAKYLARQEARRKAREGVPATEEGVEVTELEVLKEIRDALVAQRGGQHDAIINQRGPRHDAR